MSTGKSTKVVKICETCKNSFIHTVWEHGATNVGRFCSRLCRNNTGVKKKCPSCGIDMTLSQSQYKLSPNKCCSIDCRKKMVSEEDRFWWYAVKKDGCWEWTGETNPRGYGRLKVDGYRRVQAHRFSYEIHKGAIPEGMLVLHKCDNPPCTNPDHLFLGTTQDNTDDMIRKGRKIVIRGNNLPQAKINDESVRDIRSRCSKGESQKSVALHYGLSQSSVSLIVNRINWSHIE